MLELILEGKYYWVPFAASAALPCPRPPTCGTSFRLPAQFVWTNGGEASGHIPARYPRSESSPDGGLRLARKTEWQELPEETLSAWASASSVTDRGTFLLECRIVTSLPLS
jgi:type VI secretion system protein ImpE